MSSNVKKARYPAMSFASFLERSILLNISIAPITSPSSEYTGYPKINPNMIMSLYFIRNTKLARKIAGR